MGCFESAVAFQHLVEDRRRVPSTTLAHDARVEFVHSVVKTPFQRFGHSELDC